MRDGPRKKRSACSSEAVTDREARLTLRSYPVEVFRSTEGILPAGIRARLRLDELRVQLSDPGLTEPTRMNLRAEIPRLSAIWQEAVKVAFATTHQTAAEV
jgi:hypothetical protein